MKGFVFTLASAGDPVASLSGCSHGVWQPGPLDREGNARDWRQTQWSSVQLETFSDYATIRPGDRVFFFKNRRIYGVGRVVCRTGSHSGAYLNYPSAHLPAPTEPDPTAALIGPSIDPEWKRVRVTVHFVPEPQFFSQGIDMDEVLASPGADAAWGLRFFAGRSFAQLGEAETRLLVNAFERRFANEPGGPDAYRVPGRSQPEITDRLDSSDAQPFSMSSLVLANESWLVSAGVVRREAALHGLLVESAFDERSLLYRPDRLDTFHELPASPPKPPAYADWIDVVATSSYPGRSTESSPGAVHFDVIEAKSDRLAGRTEDAFDAAVSQLMKYVDFISVHYAGGNYSAVDAFFVAAGFSDAVLRRYEATLLDAVGVSARSYVLSPHESPATRVWSRLRLVSYRWSTAEARLVLTDAS
jgi:hypothetical protein